MINDDRHMSIEYLRYRTEHLRRDLEVYPNNKYNDDTYEIILTILYELNNIINDESYYSNQKYQEMSNLIERLINRNFQAQFTREIIHIVNIVNQIYKYELVREPN